MVHVNYSAVLAAALAVFVLGWLWYSPLLFYKPWMRLRGMDPVAAMAGAKMPAGKLVIELARCLVLACVIARFVALLGVSSWIGAVHVGFALWIGFAVVMLAGSVLWEDIPWKAAAIVGGHWLGKLLSQGKSRGFEPFDRWRHLRLNQGRTTAQLLARFEVLRKNNLAELRGMQLGPEQLELMGEHPDLGPVTLRQLLATWVVHDLGHVAQISRVMAKQYREAVGPWEAYLPVLHR